MTEQLYIFGTGNAAATRCYNTCFALKYKDQYLMVDAGGGNGILKRLEDMHVDYGKIHHLFVSHKHSDHILGVVWMVRMIATRMKKNAYEGDFFIYSFEDLIPAIRTLCQLTLQNKFYQMLDTRIHLIPLQDSETRHILDYDITFFDICSKKDKQFGFTLKLHSGKRLTFLGDEPYNPQSAAVPYVKQAGWLLHEAFCLYSQRDIFQPYEKHHSTVKDACSLAQQLGVENLILWHTEDRTIDQRKELYLKEGQAHFTGSLYIPDDGEMIPLA